MNERRTCVLLRGLPRYVRPLLIGVLLAAGPAVRSQELGTRPVSWEPRVPLGKCLSPAGGLLVNERPGQPWRTLGASDDVFSRDLLLSLPGLRADVETRPKTVGLTLWGNLPGTTGFSGLQSAVLLHDSRAFDLDFTLHRGRAIVTNRKEKGAARVWVRVEGAAFRLTLAEPGDAVCLALYGFWPRGVPFTAAPRPQDVPARTLSFLIVKGQVDVKAGGTEHSLSAPPGRAYFHWDSDNGPAEVPERRDRIPEWADLHAKAAAKASPFFVAIDKYRDRVKDREPRTALADVLAAAENERDGERTRAMAEFAVFGLAAINDIDRVVQTLGDPKQANVRNAAVLALRHWIGDAAGQDQRLYQFLQDQLHYSRARAATVLQLLHSAFAADDPDTYETLIAYLRHEDLAIRHLAWWHLSRLLPEDLRVPYDPAGSEAERAKAHAAWKERVPSGSLPKREPKKKGAA